MKYSRLSLAATVAALTLSVPVIAQELLIGTDALREWNLIVLGDLQSSSEVEGRTFVGGNLTGTSSNYVISSGQASTTGQAGLTVVGDVTGGIKNLNNGSGAIIGGNVESGFNLNGAAQTVKVGGTINNTNINQNVVQSGLASSDSNYLYALDRQKSLLTSSLTDLSHSLTALDANSTVTISGNRATFNATPNADGVAVFSLTSDQLNTIGEIAFNLNGADTAIVNVSGKAITLNDNFLGGTANLGEHVIWNFDEAEALTLTTAWGGSVLAPGASATTANYIQGSAVFGSLVQNGEMHVGTYQGSYTPPSTGTPGGSSGGSSGGDPVDVPEAPAMGLFLAGLAGLIYARRRFQRKAAARTE